MYNKILIQDVVLYDKPGAEKDILVEAGKIVRIADKISSDDAFIVDGSGSIICPGFIDVHIQGAGGADILDGTPESLNMMSEALAKTGTTAFLGTTVVKPKEGNKHIKNANNFVNRNLNGATLLGYHIEGPFINVNKKGGLDPNSIYSPSVSALEDILNITEGNLRMMTIAPELPGNQDLIKLLRQNNIIASFAHSEATYEETIAGFEAGINHVTHLFNAMNPINHRKPGPVTAIFENDDITAQIISDGHHLHPAAIKMIYRNIGPDRCICITDGVQGMGLPEGRYFYNSKEYESKAGAARYLDGTLIGSTMSLAGIVVQFMKFTGCSFTEAVNTASYNPAKLLRLEERKGRIAEGFDADLVLMNKEYKVEKTIINGNIFANNL